MQRGVATGVTTLGCLQAGFCKQKPGKLVF